VTGVYRSPTGSRAERTGAFGLWVPQKFQAPVPPPGLRWGCPLAATASLPVAVAADRFACAALDVTGTPSIDPANLARAPDDAELTRSAGWRV
jgi:hypothetical protein